jgi:hypothetical protein
VSDAATTVLTCATQARVADEPLRGTAPEAVGWMLVEQPGPWGPDAVRESGLDGSVAEELLHRTADLPLRIQLIRRPGNRRSVQRTLLLAHAGPASTWMRRAALQDPRRLLDLDPAILLHPREPDLGEREDGPVLLVCTHAKRDRCCARWGRPLVDALSTSHPDQVWESSHVGGHRFAGNLVVLPDGYVHGYLGEEDGRRVVAAHERGEVDVASLRGRSSLPAAAQAAEVFVRERTGTTRRDAVRILDVAARNGDNGDDVDVVVAAAGRRFVAHLVHRPLGTELLTGCDKPAPTDPGVYELATLAEA